MSHNSGRTRHTPEEAAVPMQESFSRSPSPESFPESIPSHHEILRTKLTPVLRPGEWGVFNARLTHSLVRKTVREWKFTRLTPAQLIVVLRDKLKPKPRPRPPPPRPPPRPPPPPPPPRVDAETKAAVAQLIPVWADVVGAG